MENRVLKPLIRKFYCWPDDLCFDFEQPKNSYYLQGCPRQSITSVEQIGKVRAPITSCQELAEFKRFTTSQPLTHLTK